MVSAARPVRPSAPRRTVFGVGLAVLLAVAAVACTPPPDPVPPAAPVIDQVSSLNPTPSYFFTGVGTNSANGGPGNAVTGQVFTAGITGSMPTISLSFQSDAVVPVATSVLNVSIQAAGSNGLPTGPVLATGSYTGIGSVNRALVDITLSTPVAVVAGQRYAIGASSTNAMWQVNRAPFALPNGAYAGGGAYVVNSFAPAGALSTGDDLYFRTWVIPA